MICWLPVTETAGIQAFFPDKTYITLIMLQYSPYHRSACTYFPCARSGIHFRIAQPRPAGSVTTPPSSCFFFFLQFASDLLRLSSRERTVQHDMMRGRRVTIVTNVHGCDTDSEEKKGDLGW